jgi:hypothetical protein
MQVPLEFAFDYFRRLTCSNTTLCQKLDTILDNLEASYQQPAEMDEDKGQTNHVVATHEAYSLTSLSPNDLGGKGGLRRFINLAGSRLAAEPPDVNAVTSSCWMGLDCLAKKLLDALQIASSQPEAPTHSSTHSSSVPPTPHGALSRTNNLEHHDDPNIGCVFNCLCERSVY